MSLDPLAQINAIYDDPIKRALIFDFFRKTESALTTIGEHSINIALRLNFPERPEGNYQERGSKIVELIIKKRKIFELSNTFEKLPSAGIAFRALKKNIDNPAYASIRMVFQMPCPYVAPPRPIPEGLRVGAPSSEPLSSSEERHLHEITRRDAEITELKLQQEMANNTSLAQRQEITSLKSQLRNAEQTGATQRQEITSLTLQVTELKREQERANSTSLAQRQEITSLKSQVSQSNRKLKEAEKDQDLLKQQISSLVARASESERSTPSSSEWQTKCIALDAKLKEALAEKSQLEKKNSELERMKSPTWLSSLLFLFKPVLGFLVFITRPLLRLFGFSH